MTIRKVTPILNVSDVPASLAWFESLGWKRSFSWNAGGLISRAQSSNEHGRADFAGVWMSWWLDSPADVDAMYALARRFGYSIPMPPADKPWGVREFHLRHPDGHTIRVSAGIDD